MRSAGKLKQSNRIKSTHLNIGSLVLSVIRSRLQSISVSDHLRYSTRYLHLLNFIQNRPYVCHFRSLFFNSITFKPVKCICIDRLRIHATAETQLRICGVILATSGTQVSFSAKPRWSRVSSVKGEYPVGRWERAMASCRARLCSVVGSWGG